jgi:cysteine desulfurase/selenocysteine lyase
MNYKKDFPIFKNNPNLVYLDSAATSQKPQIVIDAVNEFYTSYNSNIHRGIYPLAEKVSAKVEEVRRKIQSFIAAKESSEIIFTRGTTEALNLVMYCWGQKYIKKGDSIVTTIMDHHANFVPWQQLAHQKNARFEVVTLTDKGEIGEEDLLKKTKSARILALPYISNVLGSTNDIGIIIKKVRKQNPQIKIVIDAAQSISFLTTNVQKLDCDFMAFSGHKMFAETGIGVLYGKKDLLEDMSPFLYGGDMIREVSFDKTSFADLPAKFEGGTLHISGIISLGAAIDYIRSIGIEKIREHEQQLAFNLITQLSQIEGVKILGPSDKSLRSSIVSFTMEGIHPHDIAQVLADEQICIRAGHHCTMPLHKSLGISASSRISFSIYNTDEDGEKVIGGIKKIKTLFKK